MTDREFDELLKNAFDLYAMESLSQIPDIPDFSRGYAHGDLSMDEGYTRLMARIARGERPAPPLPDPGESDGRADRAKLRRRGRALALLSAACLTLLTLSVFLTVRIAGQPNGAPIPSGPLAQNQPDRPESPNGSDPLSTLGSADSSDSTDASVTSDRNGGLPPTFNNDQLEYEQVFPEYFRAPGTQNSTGDSGDFADPGLVISELPLLTPDNTEEKRSFEKRTGGSIVFWSGEVQVLLSYDRPVLPVAVTYTFDNPDLLPHSCTLMGREESGWVELQSYTCKISSSGVQVAFYLDTQTGGQSAVRYTDFCLSFRYTAMPDEDYQVPCASLYGFLDEARTFGFARYSVSSGVLYSLSTNLRELTLPDSFAGVPLRTVRKGAISGLLSPDLTRLTIPNGVKTMEMAAFTDCGKLTEICLPGSFELPLSVGNSRGELADRYAEEIGESADLNGDGIIGAPLTALFEDCPSLSAVDVAPDHPTLISKDGQVFLCSKKGTIQLFPATQGK